MKLNKEQIELAAEAVEEYQRNQEQLAANYSKSIGRSESYSDEELKELIRSCGTKAADCYALHQVLTAEKRREADIARLRELAVEKESIERRLGTYQQRGGAAKPRR